MPSLHDPRRSGIDVGPEPAIDNMDVLKIRENDNRQVLGPAIADRLKAVVRRCYGCLGSLRFYEEADALVLWCKREGIIGSASRLSFLRLQPHFLSVRIVAALPAERIEQFVYEIFADVNLLVFARQVEL